MTSCVSLLMLVHPRAALMTQQIISSWKKWWSRKLSSINQLNGLSFLVLKFFCDLLIEQVLQKRELTHDNQFKTTQTALKVLLHFAIFFHSSGLIPSIRNFLANSCISKLVRSYMHRLPNLGRSYDTFTSQRIACGNNQNMMLYQQLTHSYNHFVFQKSLISCSIG